MGGRPLPIPVGEQVAVRAAVAIRTAVGIAVEAAGTAAAVRAAVAIQTPHRLMARRFISIWFRHLKTDWFLRRRPALKDSPFVLATTEHGRKLITAADPLAGTQGVYPGATVADARAIIPGLEVIDDIPGLEEKLLKSLAAWAIRFTPTAAIDLPDGLLLDSTGCAHLWNGEQAYVENIQNRLKTAGYNTRIAMADTIGAAWGLTRYSRQTIVTGQTQSAAILDMPPSALRLETPTLDKLQKLGLTTIGHFAHLSRPALRRRFGPQLLLRLDQSFGREPETLQPLHPAAVYEERLPCLEPISTAAGISIALEHLLDTLTRRLAKHGKGLREAVLKTHGIDGRLSQVQIATNRPSHNAAHLFKLFELKIPSIEPGPGIELFQLEAPKVEEVNPTQERF